MNIRNINSLITTIPSYPVSPSTGSPGKAQNLPQNPGEDKDRLTLGEWWKNQAVSKGTSSVQASDDTYSRSSLVSKVRVNTQKESRIPQENTISSSVSAEKTSDEALSDVEPENKSANEPTKPTGELLSESEKAMLDSLQKADQAVRAHEMAHLAAAGGLAKGGASFKTVRGPDGKNYAVGGEVQIDMSKASTPESTLQKMRTVRRAALAPVDPSPQDQKVAAQATIHIAQATQEINMERAEAQSTNKAQTKEPEGGEEERLSAGKIYEDYAPTLLDESTDQRASVGSSVKESTSAYEKIYSGSAANSQESFFSINA